jgi:hypothetical protein
MERELPRIMERKAAVVPVVVRDCRFDILPIGELQVILPGGKPVDQQPNRDLAWRQVTEALDLVIERRRKADA